MFRIINKRTGKEPDLCQIARKCKWAKHLVYCDMEGFAVEEDGTLILLDECGNVAYPPKGMFEIIWDAPVVHEHGTITGENIIRKQDPLSNFQIPDKCKYCEYYYNFQCRAKQCVNDGVTD